MDPFLRPPTTGKEANVKMEEESYVTSHSINTKCKKATQEYNKEGWGSSSNRERGTKAFQTHCLRPPSRLILLLGRLSANYHEQQLESTDAPSSLCAYQHHERERQPIDAWSSLCAHLQWVGLLLPRLPWVSSHSNFSGKLANLSQIFSMYR